MLVVLFFRLLFSFAFGFLVFILFHLFLVLFFFYLLGFDISTSIFILFPTFFAAQVYRR